MISVVCVYNNKKILKTNLLKSLKNQNQVYEWIPLDNTAAKFKSAASALNSGGRKARGKYLIFVHQDVVLKSKDWLRRTEEILNGISDLGIAGAAGLNFKNRRVGYINDSGKIWGKPFKKPQIAQTLDECLLIIPTNIFKKLKFDEKRFNHWHLYGVDYCLSIKKFGLNIYTIPAYIHHNSQRRNLENLFKYQKRVFEKHRREDEYISTTCGFLSLSTIWLKSHFPKSRLVDFYWRVAGISEVGKLYQNLYLRAGQALKRKIKRFK